MFVATEIRHVTCSDICMLKPRAKNLHNCYCPTQRDLVFTNSTDYSCMPLYNERPDSTLHMPKRSPGPRTYPENLHSLQRYKNANLAPGKEHGEKLWDTHEELLLMVGFMGATFLLVWIAGHTKLTAKEVLKF